MLKGVVGAEDVTAAWQAGTTVLAIADDAIVTDSARDASARLGVELRRGPAERPAIPATDGTTAARRVLYRRSPGWMAPDPPRALNPSRFGKLAIVGAGGVGANTAHLAANADMADEIVLVDVVPGLAESVALDLMHASGITRSASKVVGGTGTDLLAGADVVVMTAGRPRAPGMSRADLIDVNGRVVRSVGEQIAEHAPESTVVVVTNPLDDMVLAMYEATGFPKERVIGMAGTLDGSRFRHYLAEAAGVDPGDVNAITTGSHGPGMVPMTDTATIKGRLIADVLTQDQIDRAVQDTIDGGAAVVALRRTGSATIAPAHAIVEVLDHLRGALSGEVVVTMVGESHHATGVLTRVQLRRS